MRAAVHSGPSSLVVATAGVTVRGSQLPHPERLCRSAGGACTPARRVGLTRLKSACGAGPDASGNLIVGVLHSIPDGHRGAERRVASRSLRRTRLRGRLTATRPCRETHRGLVGTPALADCLWPVMDSRVFVAPGCKPSHALLPALLARFARSLRTGTPRYRSVESLPSGVLVVPVVSVASSDSDLAVFQLMPIAHTRLILQEDRGYWTRSKCRGKTPKTLSFLVL
jgi:hypothetical protein